MKDTLSLQKPLYGEIAYEAKIKVINVSINWGRYLLTYLNLTLFMKKHAYFFALLLLTIFRLQAQDNEGDESIPTEYPDFSSGSAEVELEISAVVRFQNSSDVYLRWSNNEFSSLNTVYYRAAGALVWNELQTITNNILINNLALDTKYEWRIECNTLGEIKYSNIGSFTTEQIDDNIEVSTELYNNLVDWSHSDQTPINLPSYLNGITDISIHEKLSFFQSYEYGGKPFRRIENSDNNYSDIRHWVIPGTDDFAGDCNCKVVTNGLLTVAPIDRLDENEGIIFPKKNYYKKTVSSATTYFDYVSRGASKFVALRQRERDGGSQVENTNLNPANGSGTSPQYSKIKFYLLCEDDSKVPSSCGCCRTLSLRYNYSSKIQASSDTRPCIWSKGSYAKAEDAALVMAFYNSDLGKSKVLSAGHNMVSAKCNKNWNSTFWINFLDLAVPIAKVLAQDGKLEDYLKITDEVTKALKKLFVTPTHRTTGKCDETIIDSRDLVDGSDLIEICPNNPVEIAMFSFHHILAGGYGCWHPKAAVASDMYLAGVVESRYVPDDPNCCTVKRALYIASSCGNSTLGPGNIKEGHDVVSLDPSHSLSDRLRDVGFFIGQFGKWDNLNFGVSSNLPLLTKEFETQLRGPSCKPNAGGTTQRSKEATKFVRLIRRADNFILTLEGFKDSKVNLNLINLSGINVKSEKIIKIYSNSESTELDVLNLPKGIYIVSLRSENFEFHEKLLLD